MGLPKERNAWAPEPLILPKGGRKVPKPPKSNPHSDIDGVHEDERPNTDTAREAGQDTGDLQRARKQSAARPPYSDDRDNRDDRS